MTHVQFITDRAGGDRHLDGRNDTRSRFVGLHSQGVKEMVLIALLAVLVWLMAGRLELLDRVTEFTRLHEHWELDELVVSTTFMGLALGVFVFRRWREACHVAHRLELQRQELEQALGEVRQLQGIIPICAACKKVRDEGGYWQQVEEYVSNHSTAEFSHSLCLECTHVYFAELTDEQGQLPV